MPVNCTGFFLFIFYKNFVISNLFLLLLYQLKTIMTQLTTIQREYLLQKYRLATVSFERLKDAKNNLENLVVGSKSKDKKEALEKMHIEAFIQITELSILEICLEENAIPVQPINNKNK